MSSSSKAVSLAFTVGAESVGTGGAFTCSHKSMMLAAVATFAATMKVMARVGNRTRMMSLLSIKFSQWTSVYSGNATRQNYCAPGACQRLRDSRYRQCGLSGLVAGFSIHSLHFALNPRQLNAGNGV